MCAACTQYNTFFISLAYMHVCAHEIDDIEALVQSTGVHTRCVHDDIICTSTHACQLGSYTPNLIHMLIDIYMNCKPR